ncbi:MAG: hypothetical protein CHACPFDD_03432 [Phycisphaerae bacterium]|nr:hypothetical protein [Phycisphaerae bacterium]
MPTAVASACECERPLLPDARGCHADGRCVGMRLRTTFAARCARVPCRRPLRRHANANDPCCPTRAGAMPTAVASACECERPLLPDARGCHADGRCVGMRMRTTLAARRATRQRKPAAERRQSIAVGVSPRTLARAHPLSPVRAKVPLRAHKSPLTPTAPHRTGTCRPPARPPASAITLSRCHARHFLHPACIPRNPCYTISMKSLNAIAARYRTPRPTARRRLGPVRGPRTTSRWSPPALNNRIRGGPRP